VVSNDSWLQLITIAVVVVVATTTTTTTTALLPLAFDLLLSSA
jgi:hypothetical protein